jgi:hypothetical protein
MKYKLRVSGYGDYIAVDKVDDKGNILETPIYLQRGKELKIKTGKPNNERPKGACTSDEFFDKWTLKLEEDNTVFLRWDNGILGVKPEFTEIRPSELLDFKYATIIK